MAQPATFQRIYRDNAGLEHPATAQSVEAVLRSMRESVDGILPFKVRLRMDDGSAVVVKPKSWGA
jgi:hypothetical protein